jgi:hypothetical protein
MDGYGLIYIFLVLSFVVHGIAFTILGFKRGKIQYFFLTGTFVFLTAVYLIKFEGWSVSIPGTALPLTYLLRIAAFTCTASYLRTIYREEGSWLWRLRLRL